MKELMIEMLAFIMEMLARILATLAALRIARGRRPRVWKRQPAQA